MKNLGFTFIVLISTCIACTVTKKVKTGEMAYELKQYALAVELLESEYKKSNQDNIKARKAYLLAKSYDILQEFGEALKWYDTADQLSYNENSQIDLAYALKRNERYGDAAELFSEIYQKTKILKYKQENDLCKRAVVQIKNTDDFQVKSFGSNSVYADYSPVFYENGFLLFTSDREGNTKKGDYKWTGNAFSDLYVTNSRGRNPMMFDATLNTEANEGAACFSQDFNEIFFTRCISTEQRDQFCKIYYSQKPNGFWLEPEALMFFNDKTNFGQPTLIENDSVLIFTVTPPDSETSDLYYSVRVEGGWSEAEIMPAPINTEGDEKFPTSHKDTLYFASNHHPGYGGYDIFKTYLKANGTWAYPQNVGIPINSGSDDFGLAVNPDFKSTASIEIQGYFSSSRNTGFNDDIFFFSKFPSKVEEENDPTPEEEEKTYTIYLAGRVVEVNHEDGDPNKKIIGKVPLSNSTIVISGDDGDVDLKTNNKGRFITNLTENFNYNVRASKTDYLTNQVKLNTIFKNLKSDTTINIEIDLEKIIYDKEIVLNNIYYDFEKWDIRDDAKATLDSLSALINLNPDLKIQISAHTDCRGEFDYNQSLSQKRAQSVVDYLKAKNSSLQRLKAKGYGESSPTVPCPCDSCTEEQHQSNRRTTFTILK